MLDGIHFDIPTEAVQDSDILEFKRYGNGERANYKGLIITRDNLSCSVRGSLHKYFNDGKHNYNDFTLSNFIRTISDLEKTLNINADIIRIGRIETGVNLDIDMDVDEFIGSVILFNNTHPTTCDNGIIFKLNDYDLKLYRKELKGHDNRLRIELAIKKKRKRESIIKEYATYCSWKIQFRLPPFAKSKLTPEKTLLLPLKYPGRRGHFYFSFTCFCLPSFFLRSHR